MEPFAVTLDELSLLRDLRHSLASWLDEAGASANARDSMVIATHEATVNALVHGDAGAPVTVTVNRHSGGGRFMIVVRNDGGWKEQTPEAGRGLPLMRGLMSEVGIHPATAVYMRKDV